MISTVGDLIKALKKYKSNTKIHILFECTEAKPKGFQYLVPILDIASTSNDVMLCHEEDYENHYSKR